MSSEAASGALAEVGSSVANTAHAYLPPEMFLEKARCRHTFVSFFVGTLGGNFVTLVVVSLLLVLLGALSWMAVGCGHTCTAAFPYPADFTSAWWLSWGLHFDPGTQTGIEAQEAYPQKWVVVGFSILGFILNLIFLGLIVENVRKQLDTWRRAYGCVVANDHTVILGWTDKTLFLLGELAEMMTDLSSRGGTIVVLGELEPLEMKLEVAIAFPDWRKKWRRVQVKYYCGKPYEVDDLLKVAVYAAERIIVLGCSRRPRVADSQMLTTICALRCLPDARYLTSSTNVVAELKQPQNEPVVLHVGGDAAADNKVEGSASSHPLSITPVVGNHATNAIMSLCALDPSAGLALLDLMNFSGDQIETIPCAPFTQKGPITFGVLRNAFNAATPLGTTTIDAQGREQIIIAPPDDHVIGSDMRVLVIALDQATALSSSRLAVASQRPKKSNSFARLRKAVTGVRLASGRASPEAEGSKAAEGSRIDEGDGTRVVAAVTPRCLIFIGWQRGFESLLRLLDARLPPNSEVYILSEQSEKRRQVELESEGLALDGGPATKDFGGEADEAEDDSEGGLRNCTIQHVYGYTTDKRAMLRLPLGRADAAVVVADADENDKQACGGAELQIADAEALTSTILLRRLHQQIAREEGAKPLTIVTEFVDLLTKRLFEKQENLISHTAPRKPAPPASGAGGGGGNRASISRQGTASGGTPTRQPSAATAGAVAAAARDGALDSTSAVESVVFHRNYIETTALSLASHSNTSWVTVQMLLDPHSGYSIESVRANLAMPIPTDGVTTCSWSDVSDQLVAVRAGLLIGWRRERGEVEINPSNKLEQLPWRATDELIVLKSMPEPEPGRTEL